MTTPVPDDLRKQVAELLNAGGPKDWCEQRADAILALCRDAAKAAIDEPVETGDQYGSCMIRSPYTGDHKRAIDRRLR